MKRKRGEGDPVANVSWLIVIIVVFLLVYVIFLPEQEKEKFIEDPENYGNYNDRVDYRSTNDDGNYGDNYDRRGDYTRGGYYPTTETLLLSETPGKLYPYGQHLFVKPLASAHLFSEEDKTEERLTNSLVLESNLLSGAGPYDFTFMLADPKAVTKLQLLPVIQQGGGDISIQVNSQEIFRGHLTTQDLPLLIPRAILRQRNTISFSTPSGALGKHTYVLRDVSLFITDRLSNSKEFRDFVLSQDQLYNVESLSMYYFVNCFTLREQGTLRTYLNGNLLNQQFIVCDAGEVSQDLPLNFLLQGRNILEFEVDKGNYVLEQLSLEGNTGIGRVPTYFFTLQIEDIGRGLPIGVDLKFYDSQERKVGTLLVNGFEYYLDTRSNGAFFDVTPYVVPGQNVIKLIPTTELDVIDLSVYTG